MENGSVICEVISKFAIYNTVIVSDFHAVRSFAVITCSFSHCAAAAAALR